MGGVNEQQGLRDPPGNYCLSCSINISKILQNTWDKEDKDGREIKHTRGAKLVSGDARITNVANKIEHVRD